MGAMFRGLHVRLLAVLVFVLLAVIPAVPVYAYTYQATYGITESGGTAYVMLPVRALAANQWLADNGFMLATALDTRVSTLGGTAQPHMVASDRTLTAVPVPANSQTNLYFRTGESALPAMYVIVGRGGYVTTADHADLEFGAGEWSIEWSGYFDAGRTDRLVSKADSYELYSPVAGTVRGYVFGTAGTENLTPNAAGDYNNISNESGCGAGAAHFQCVDDPVGAPDDAATYVYSTLSGADVYNITNTGLAAEDRISSVSVFMRYRVGACDANIRPVLHLGEAETLGAGQCEGAGAWTNNTQALARPGGGSWAVGDLDGLQAGVSLTAGGAFQMDVTQVYVTVSYSPGVYVEAAVASGEHDIILSRTVNTIDLEVDTVSQDTDAFAAAVADNGNSVVSAENGPAAYTEYVRVTVAGVLNLHYQPITMVSGTTLPDRAGVAQNGVITWGVNPPPPGVSVVMGGLVSVSQPSAGVASTPPAESLPAVELSDWFQDPAVGGALLTHPFRSFVTLISDNTALTELQSWRFFGLMLVLFSTVTAARLLRGHLFLAGVVCAITVLLLVQQTVWPMWALSFILIALLAGWLAERTPAI